MILVAGGTGTLGTVLTAGLLQRGTQVRVLTRSGTELSDDVEGVVGDVRSPDDAARAVQGARAVVSVVTGFGPVRGITTRGVDLEGNRTLFAAAREAGIEHFVLLSVHEASPDHPIELFRMKYAAEQELRASGLAWTIVRPTAYLETWVRLLCGPLVEKGKTRVFGRGQNPINFVSVRDVARVVEQALLDPEQRGQAIEVAGPENLTMNAVVETFLAETGASGSVRHVPRAAMRAGSVVLRAFNPSLAALISAALVMDTRDMRAMAAGGATYRLQDVCRALSPQGVSGAE